MELDFLITIDFLPRDVTELPVRGEVRKQVQDLKNWREKFEKQVQDLKNWRVLFSLFSKTVFADRGQG